MSEDKLIVTQHAREAVAKQVEAAFYDECEYAQEMRQGLHDSDPNLQHFARFEAEATARSAAELVEVLRQIAEPVPAEFEARGDPESGRVSKFYKAGRFDRAQIAARQALHDRALGK